MDTSKLILYLSVLLTRNISSVTPCRRLGQLENGRTFFRYGGLYASFICNAGFSLVGHGTSSCVRGKWRKPAPICVASGCIIPDGIAHGSLRTSHSGAIITFICTNGYKLHGSPLVYCDGKKWNGTGPVCRESDVMNNNFSKKNQMTENPGMKKDTVFSRTVSENLFRSNENTNHYDCKSKNNQNVNTLTAKDMTTDSRHLLHHPIKSLSTFVNIKSSEQESGNQKKQLKHAVINAVTGTREVTLRNKDEPKQLTSIRPLPPSTFRTTTVPRLSIPSSTVWSKYPSFFIPLVIVSTDTPISDEPLDIRVLTKANELFISATATTSFLTSTATAANVAATVENLISSSSNDTKPEHFTAKTTSLNILKGHNSTTNGMPNFVSLFGLKNQVTSNVSPVSSSDDGNVEKIVLFDPKKKDRIKNITDSVMQITYNKQENISAETSSNDNSLILTLTSNSSPIVNVTQVLVSSAEDLTQQNRTVKNAQTQSLLGSNAFDNVIEKSSTEHRHSEHHSENQRFWNTPYTSGSPTLTTHQTTSPKPSNEPIVDFKTHLITTQRIISHSNIVINSVFPGVVNKFFKRRPPCAYPPVPIHGTFRFLTLIDPHPNQYPYYIQYSCYPGYTLSRGDEYSFCMWHGAWSGVTPVCLEHEPCSETRSGCSQICQSYGEGHVECPCKDGFQLLIETRD